MTKDTEALREALKDLARGVFIDAATITHHSWVDGTNGREPDFDEYAGDYAESFADAYVDNITAALATPASDVVAVDVDDAQALAREFKRMQGLIYCPGVLRCAKCDFRLIKTTLTPAGAFANEEPDSCPNCNVPMWRVTWQDEAHEAYRVAESQMERALGAEKKLAHPLLAQSVDHVAGGEALREAAARYADMDIDERAEAMADDCAGDPWELIGYFREKLRQSREQAQNANNAAISLAKKLAALKGPAA